MHRRQAIQAVRATCTQSRNSATAARAKPASWETDSAVSPSSPNKWGRQLPIFSTRREGLNSTGKWARPTTEAPGTTPHPTAFTPNSTQGRTPNQASSSKHPLPPKFALSSQRNPPSIPSNPRSNLPQRTTTPRVTRLNQGPPNSSMSKWTREAPPHPTQRSQQPGQGSSRPDFSSSTSTTRSSPSQNANSISFARSDTDLARGSNRDKLAALVKLPRVDGASNTDANNEGRQHSRVVRKDRTSILARRGDNVAIPSHSRVSHKHGDHTLKVKRKKTSLPKEKQVAADVYIPSTVSVGTLSRLLGVKLETLQRRMFRAGMGDESSYDHVLTSDYAVLLAEEFGRNPIVNDEAAFDIYAPPAHPDPSKLPSRPPVVTIMGHVDHGKTTLLDTLRSASVAKSEAGGITQHIGAFSVPVPNSGGPSGSPESITFLDTPGHAAFSAMRARGARVTDIVVLVVAADDGIMPQTKEVINLVKQDEGKVGVVVAINKVDKPDVNIDFVQKALLAEGMQLEAFGGDVPSVEVSGLTGHGLPNLVETLSAMAEMQDLRAEREGPVLGYVLESRVQKGLGPVATVLVLRGCLKTGSHIISGVTHAKVRAMNDSSNKSVKAVYPGTAVTVSGWKSLPDAGDEVLQASEDVGAINANRKLERERRELELASPETHPAPTSAHDSSDDQKVLRLIVKGDVSGSVEAVVGALEGIGNHLASVKVVSSGVGDITESDVTMAKAVDGIVVGFSVTTPRAMEMLAAQNQVSILSSGIIYRLMDEVKSRLVALLPPVLESKVIGEATVLQLFDIHLKAKTIKKVAGCRVVNGIIEKSRNARVIRDGVTIHDGTLDTMRYLKKDVTEVRKGSECGVSFGDFSGLQEGDLIQMYQVIEKPATL
ncbi:TRAFAC class translation factor GTPase superfamily protein [Pleurotus pulmonarius]